MPARHQQLHAGSDGGLDEAFRTIREELKLPVDFDAATLAEAEAAVRAAQPAEADETAIEFVTIDPEGATDLDQALHIERADDGFTVRYAIADVPLFVVAGGAIDAEARRRGQTLYAADGRIPLHPTVISEDAASLLADQDRSAYVWRFTLDASGTVTATALQRARVRSREQLTYEEAQRRIDAGDSDTLGLLKEVGALRIALEQQRGGASLDMPEEEVKQDGDTWRIERRALLPVETWNAQISLMTGMAAASLQIEAGAGILRTMPAPSKGAMREFVHTSTALGMPWNDGERYGDYLRRLDRTKPETLAILTAARRLFRGAGYLVLDGAPAGDVSQAAIGAPYAHTTAPLRRLVDRYVLAHCEAIANDREIPQWAKDGLAGLPEIMQESAQRASALERASVDVVEIAVLQDLVGEEFDAVVLERREKGATIVLVDPPAEAGCDTAAEPGSRIRVRLVEADLAARRLRFADA